MLSSERVQTIMTEAVLSIGPDEGASAALDHFSSYPIHHLPVVQERRVVGMLSTADIMKLEHLLPRTGAASKVLLDQRMKVRDLLRGPAITIRANQSIEEAATLMARSAIHALPVVNDQGHLMGIVTTTDIMSALLGAAPAPRENGTIADHLKQRLKDLEELLRLTERYLNFGQDEQLHAQMLRSIARLRLPQARPDA